MSSKFYTDPQFQTAYSLTVQCAALGTADGVSTTAGVATAGTSPTVLSTKAGVYGPPVFVRRSAINTVTVTTITAPAVTPGTLGVLNGTNTVATIVVPAAGTTTQVAATVANSTFAAGAGPTFQYQGTASATTVVGGFYQILLDAQELFN